MNQDASHLIVKVSFEAVCPPAIIKKTIVFKPLDFLSVVFNFSPQSK